jgi:hypothetical protein
MEEVSGSIPLRSTNLPPKQAFENELAPTPADLRANTPALRAFVWIHLAES